MTKKMTAFFASRTGIIIVGIIIGVCATGLQKLGNPPNMGVCVACFQRDIAGALGFHRAGVVQYIRPEILGFVLGSLIAALAFREFRARAGSAPIVRFMLGMFAMIGALAFLGCPWRAILRLAGGDFNAIIGLVGLTIGVTIGVQFLKSGFNLGRSYKTYPIVGLILPFIMATLLIFLLVKPAFISFSEKGPGAMHAPVFISLGAGLLIGILAQRTRFCTMGSIRDIILMRDTHLVSGVAGMVIAAFMMNLIFGAVKFGFPAQPIAHSSHVWNFLGMILAGLAFALAGGCPGRQLFLAGEGDSDSGVFILGMIVGAGVAHNFTLAGKPDKIVDGVLNVGGISTAGMVAVITGIIFCCAIGYFMREKI
jgi:YedE family putative selenium metabolism protein